MQGALQVKNITNWIKIFTHISATVLLIANNNFDKLKYLLPIIILIFFVDYSRDYYLVPSEKAPKYIWISIAIEMIFIISIGFIDKNDINLLFFFVCLSSTIIIHSFSYSVYIVGSYFISMFFIYAMRNGFDELTKSFVPMFFNYGVSTAFVTGMSLLVKLQIREKERLERMNMELEGTYKKLIENSSASQKLSIEQERTRMAREIHDTLAHTLTTLIVQLEVCKKLAALDPSRLPVELEKAQELSRSGFNDVKHSIKALRPQAMEDKSFFASINSIIDETMKNTNVHIEFNNSISEDTVLTSQVEIALFRAIQESITNSIRHGQASEIQVHMNLDEETLQLSILDNGKGCSSIKKGYGMQGMRERVEGLKGSVEFSSSKSKGFKTEILIPYKVV